jgi:cation transport ATPase
MDMTTTSAYTASQDAVAKKRRAARHAADARKRHYRDPATAGLVRRATYWLVAAAWVLAFSLFSMLGSGGRWLSLQWMFLGIVVVLALPAAGSLVRAARLERLGDEETVDDSA